MTDETGPMHDEVLWLGIELAAVAKPRDAAAFKTLLMRFTEAVVREAFEHQDEIRERLAIARPPRADADLIESLKSGARACPYCHAFVESMAGHECERKRELGLVDAASSTGAAAAEAKADIPTAEIRRTAETPAAPSKLDSPSPQAGQSPSLSHTTGDHDGTSLAATRRLDERQPHGEQPHAAQVPRSLGRGEAADAGAEGRGAGVREHAAPDRRDGEGVGRPTNTGRRGADLARAEHCADEDRRSRHVGGEAHHSVVAAPAPPKVSGDVWTPPAGPSQAGEEGLQRKRRGPLPRFTDDEVAKLRAEFAAACEANGGEPPYGWVTAKARELDAGLSTIRRTLGLEGRVSAPRSNGHAPPVDYSRPKAPELVHRESQQPQGTAREVDEPAKNKPTQQPVDTTRPASGSVANGHAQPREHGNSHNCWCRKSPCSTKNPWCSIKKPAGMIPGLAGLQDRPSRTERYMPGRRATEEVG